MHLTILPSTPERQNPECHKTLGQVLAPVTSLIRTSTPPMCHTNWVIQLHRLKVAIRLCCLHCCWTFVGITLPYVKFQASEVEEWTLLCSASTWAPCTCRLALFQNSEARGNICQPHKASALNPSSRKMGSSSPYRVKTWREVV